MLFNSFEYIFLFLPFSVAVFFLLNKCFSSTIAKAWLVVASLFFYSWWNIIYLPLILTSILLNYLLGSILFHKDYLQLIRKDLLIAGLIFNLGLLGYFKYMDFFISNINVLLASSLPLTNVVLPLGISFFTFTQIAYLIDTYRGEVKEYGIINYALFVTFFPHLLAGPILHHKEMMPQFEDTANKRFNAHNISQGLFLFFIGLVKKVVIADTLAIDANYGFNQADYLSMVEAWITSLSYTLQLYFDFSGYTDMAIGSALLFNIKLPINFNSPYKSLNIQEFWRRWHMTLGRFFRDYVYVPLGGNRLGETRVYANLLITWALVGLWHGAGWTFVLWGMLHGLALVVHRLWKKTGIIMPRLLAWGITFNFVNICWVFFRADSIKNAMVIIEGMFGLHGFSLPSYAVKKLAFLNTFGLNRTDYLLPYWYLSLITIPLLVLVAARSSNSIEFSSDLRTNTRNALIMAIFITIGILFLGNTGQFLYFNF